MNNSYNSLKTIKPENLNISQREIQEWQGSTEKIPNTFVVQSAQSCSTFCHTWTAARQASLYFTISWSLLKLMSTDVAIQASWPLSSPSLPAFKLFQCQGFFLMSQIFASGGESIGFSVSASVFPMNIQG